MQATAHVITFFLSLSLSLSLLVCLLDLTVDLHTNIISSNLLVLLLLDLFVVPCCLGKTARTEVAHWRGEWPTQLEGFYKTFEVKFSVATCRLLGLDSSSCFRVQISGSNDPIISPGYIFGQSGIFRVGEVACQAAKMT